MAKNKKLSPQEVIEEIKKAYCMNPLPADEEQKVKERVDWLVRFMVCRYHFVHKVLGYITRVYTYRVPTMGVTVTGSKLVLYINPRFVKDLKDEYAVFILYHEVSHLVLHHCTSRRLGDRRLGNYATDLAANELIHEEKESCERPRDDDGNLMGLFVDDLKKNPMYADIEPMKSAEWYYEYLRRKQKEQGGGKKGDKGEGSGIPGDGDGETLDGHGGWEENEVAGERIRAIVREVEASDMWGNMSATAKETVLAAQVRKINWRNKIRTWFGNIAWKDRHSTRKRPNRRTGYIHPGYKKSYVDRWLIAADTSGSIDSDLLSQWIGVVNQLTEVLPIDFMQFDCDKTQDPRPYDRRRLNLEFKGRGGTSFDPVMKIVDERHYKGVMILTDGEASKPPKPRAARVLWVLPKGHHPPVEWGERVYLTRGA